MSKPRWLVINKSDLMTEEEGRAKAIGIAQALGYTGPAFLISGVAHIGTTDLCEAVMRFLETSEAPAQGNLPLPVVVKKPAAKRLALKKAAPKKKVAAKKKAAVKKRPVANKKAVAKKKAQKKPLKKKAAASKKKKSRR